jgi:hypothetical protein
MAEWLCSLARTNVAVADLGGVQSHPIENLCIGFIPAHFNTKEQLYYHQFICF